MMQGDVGWAWMYRKLKNKDEANQAIKMMALPVFMSGFGVLLISAIKLLMLVGNQSLDQANKSIYIAIISLIAIIAALGLRKGQMYWFWPCALVAVLYSFSAISVLVFDLATSSQIVGFGVEFILTALVSLMQFIVPMLLIIFCIGGIRGWLWLGRN